MRTVDDVRFAIALLAQASRALTDDRHFTEFFIGMSTQFGRSPTGRFAMDVAAALADSDAISDLPGVLAMANAINVAAPAVQRVLGYMYKWSPLDPSAIDVAKMRTHLQHLSTSKLNAGPPSDSEAVSVAVTLAVARRLSRPAGMFGGAPVVIRKNFPQQGMSDRRSAREAVEAPAWPSAADPEPSCARITIHFGTNRDLLRGPADSVAFGGRRSAAEQPMSFGVATVTVPESHNEGHIERPKLWKFEFKEDKSQHMVIDQVRVVSDASWIGSAGGNDEALLFIHGFNVDFDEALYRTAQIAHDLRFPGLTLCFSWASRGETIDYTVDEESARWSVSHLEQFLKVVATRLSLQRIHIVAHSMGNRALLDVLNHWTSPSGTARLSQIVLAAPDVDAGIFRQVAQIFRRFDRVTLYASSEDKPLRVSRRIHSYPRAGNATPPLVVAHADTVDVSAVGGDLFGLGHSYFAVKPKVFSDLFYIVRHGLGPAQRVSVRLVPSNGHFELV